jgi:hypothetical protein
MTNTGPLGVLAGTIVPKYGTYVAYKVDRRWFCHMVGAR